MQQGNSAWPIGHIRSQQVSEVTVIEFHGEIDIAAAQQILPDLDAATATPGQTVVIDLTPAEFFDCYGLRLLCHAERRGTERRGWLLLVCPHPIPSAAAAAPPTGPRQPAMSRTGSENSNACSPNSNDASAPTLLKPEPPAGALTIGARASSTASHRRAERVARRARRALPGTRPSRTMVRGYVPGHSHPSSDT
ncbi:STAS domain-containing protein [Streptomyces lutosisoli]|uniref:STAS domain-containing protein n=1 Tax=Streptomyces lutosisoli TaxID=2665721 RepID=A0ABW2VDS4_9ACTN